MFRTFIKLFKKTIKEKTTPVKIITPTSQAKAPASTELTQQFEADKREKGPFSSSEEFFDLIKQELPLFLEMMNELDDEKSIFEIIIAKMHAIFLEWTLVVFGSANIDQKLWELSWSSFIELLRLKLMPIVNKDYVIYRKGEICISLK